MHTWNNLTVVCLGYSNSWSHRARCALPSLIAQVFAHVTCHGLHKVWRLVPYVLVPKPLQTWQKDSVYVNALALYCWCDGFMGKKITSNWLFVARTVRNTTRKFIHSWAWYGVTAESRVTIPKSKALSRRTRIQREGFQTHTKRYSKQKCAVLLYIKTPGAVSCTMQSQSTSSYRVQHEAWSNH